MIARRTSTWQSLTILVTLCLALQFPWSTAEAETPEPVENYAVKQYQQAIAFYNNLTIGANPGQRERWLKGAKLFQHLYRNNPTHELAPACLFMLGRIQRQMSRHFNNTLDLDRAFASFQDLVLLFPEHSLADDSLYQVAMIQLHDLKNADEAARTLARILSLYPAGDMATAAAGELEKLEKLNTLATEIPGPAEPLLLQPVARKAASPPGPQTRIQPLLQPEAKKAVAQIGLTSIQPIRYWSTADYTRVVIETGVPVSYNHSMLPEQDALPRRFYVDLQNSKLGKGMEASVPIDDGLLKQIRTAQFSPTSVRVVLDLESVVDYQIFNLQDPFRVVIDAKGKQQQQPKQKLASIAPDHGFAPSLPQQLGLGIRRIVLDPGHGGKDPGAISPSGVMEKDIVLRVAKKLALHLERDLGCEIIFTRDRDIFVPLEERTAIANTKGADLFISIHANSAPSTEARGIETYFLDFATSKDAMRVAARENASSALQLSDLQSILTDLMRNTKINESAKLAEFVQANLVTGLSRYFPDVHDLGVKRAPFVVLIGAQMPAVLTEISFLSNLEEEKRLTDPDYQEKLAMQIAAGISRYVTDLNLADMKLSTR
jgi:N-acetylmuramoyl-L-alanine amidase